MTATELACHYCLASDREAHGPVIGWLVSVSGRAKWSRPTCAVHKGQGWSYPDSVTALVDDPATIREGEPCGSIRVLRYVEGHEAESVWCPRTDGPCPYPATMPTTIGSNVEPPEPHRVCAVTTLDEGRKRRQA